MQSQHNYFFIRQRACSLSVAFLALFILCGQSLASAFIFPSPAKQQPQCSAANGGNDVAVQLSDDNARAGKSGYSVLRQPLHKESWDPKLDPTFDAPETLKEGDADQHNMEWWSNKKFSASKDSKQSMASSTPTTTALSKSKVESSSDSLDLFQRSLDTLDFPFVLNFLRNECFTTPSKQIIAEALNAPSIKSKKKLPPCRAYQPLTADTPSGVQDRYDAVQEMQYLLDPLTDIDDAYYKNRRGYQVTLGNGNPPPLEGLSFDLDSILQVVRDGQILEGPELLDVSNMMNAMEDLQLWSLGLQRIENLEFSALPELVDDIQLNTTLHTLLEDAFDEDGKLSGTTFPVLGRLRARIRSLKADILNTLDTLVSESTWASISTSTSNPVSNPFNIQVSMPSIKSKLALESGGPLYSEISNGGGRLVLPMDPKYASQYGIVHDSSRSGSTVYVEPSEVVGPTNELRQTEGELKTEEARVWRSLTEQVWSNRKDLERSVRAVGQLDLVLARTLLGKKLNGVIPTVEDEGVISLKVRQPSD